MGSCPLDSIDTGNPWRGRVRERVETRSPPPTLRNGGKSRFRPREALRTTSSLLTRSNARPLLQVVEEPEDRGEDERDERDADEDVLFDLGACEGTETLQGET